MKFAKILRASFFIEYLLWLLLPLYQKNQVCIIFIKCLISSYVVSCIRIEWTWLSVLKDFWLFTKYYTKYFSRTSYFLFWCYIVALTSIISQKMISWPPLLRLSYKAFSFQHKISVLSGKKITNWNSKLNSNIKTKILTHFMSHHFSTSCLIWQDHWMRFHYIDNYFHYITKKSVLHYENK